MKRSLSEWYRRARGLDPEFKRYVCQDCSGRHHIAVEPDRYTDGGPRILSSSHGVCDYCLERKDLRETLHSWKSREEDEGRRPDWHQPELAPLP